METNNGALGASVYVDQLRRIEDASEAEVERIKHVYAEIERRDGAAQWHAALWFRFACVLGVVLMVAISAVVIFALKASRVQAYVQPVQVTDEGKMVLVGMPKDLLDYQVEDAAYMDMVAQYVTKRRWKGDEESMKRTRNAWHWLYAHSCGLASQQLAQAEATEQPFKPSKKLASIEVRTITKTATPESYQVVWKEVTVDKGASTLKEHDYLATLTVGRIRPKTLQEAMENRLGLCVTGLDITPTKGAMP